MSTTTIKQQETYSLSDLISYYEVCNRAEGKSHRTIDWYTANLKQFHRYLKIRHLSDSIHSVDIKLLRQYILYLMKRKRFEDHPLNPTKTTLISASTVHGHVRTLRAFFSWLVREELIKTNVTKDLKPPKVPKKVVSTLSDEEIVSILRTFDPRKSSDARNQTLFMIMIDTGLRIGECANLKVQDLHLDDGFLKVTGKGNKERIVPIGNNAQRAIHRYLFRHRPGTSRSGTDKAFLSIHGTPISENGIKLAFARLAQRSGVKRLHAHLCRHTFATRFLINGGDVFTLQQILGHSTLDMVKHYVNLASSHIAIQHQKYSPLDRLNVRKS
ncbi:tyrosine-type recombinase/integrase [Chloroflexota bacterium]